MIAAPSIAPTLEQLEHDLERAWTELGCADIGIADAGRRRIEMDRWRARINDMQAQILRFPAARLSDEQLRELANDAFVTLNWAKRMGMKKDQQIEETVRAFEISLGYRTAKETTSTEPAVREIVLTREETDYLRSTGRLRGGFVRFAQADRIVDADGQVLKSKGGQT